MQSEISDVSGGGRTGRYHCDSPCQLGKSHFFYFQTIEKQVDALGGEFLLKIGVKKFGKKEYEIISLSPFSEENGLTPGEERYNGKAGKKFEKKVEKDLEGMDKRCYLCIRFRP